MAKNLNSKTCTSIDVEDVDSSNDFTDLCRVCMSKSDDLKSAFSSELTGTVKELEFCTGILMTKEDTLPTMLCEFCLKTLSIAYKFKTLCLKSQEEFQNLLGHKPHINGIKEEKVDSDNNDNAVQLTVKVEVKEDNVDDDVFNTADENEKSETNYLLKLKPSATTKGLATRATLKKPTKSLATARNSKKKNSDPTEVVAGKKLECDCCNMRFGTRELMLKHIRDDHGCGWVCEICGKQFLHRSSHYSHMKSHRPPQNKCAHCDYKTPHRADLKKHNLIHTDTKLYVCEYCTLKFRTISNLYGHIRRSHNGSKMYRCQLCGFSFHSQDKLRRHQDSHDHIKRYECELCQTKFTRRCHWKRHLEKQHSVNVPQVRPGRHKVNVVRYHDEEPT